MPGYAADTESLRAEMRQLVRQAAEPAVAGEGVKAAIARAARRLGFSYGRTKRYWYQEVLHPFAVDVERARAEAGGQTVRRRPSRGRSGGGPRLGAFLYDGDGIAWRLGSADLSKAVGRTESELNVGIGEYAVRCLGWIEILHSPLRLSLKFAADVVRPRALHSAFEALHLSRRIEVSIVIWCEGRWVETPFADPNLAQQHLIGVIDRTELRRKPRFSSIRKSVGALIQDRDLEMLALLREAGSVQGRISLNEAIKLAERSRTAIVIAHRLGKASATGSIWSFDYHPPTNRVFSADEHRTLGSFEPSSSPDPDYFNWCAASYEEASLLNEPVVDDVSARVMRRRLPPIDFDYRRVLLPIRDKYGDTIMAVATRRIDSPPAERLPQPGKQ